ncbi:histone-like nucleoid-structuring protein Lsr2 [Jatrophihabitans sp.]|uniref:histone-like nucleoid-structuring protein Lsr2 n=1 Tax=Jatrophihabitans sp. TaxID=1932789 RepID=UPI002EDBD17C
MMDDASMAKTVVTTDDIDGSPNAETVTFSFDGRSFEIDLSKKSRAALEKALKPYIDAGRPVGARTTRGGGSSGGRGRGRRSASVDLAAVRAWAAENGIAVSDRGRISGSVLEQYQAAQ